MENQTLNHERVDCILEDTISNINLIKGPNILNHEQKAEIENVLSELISIKKSIHHEWKRLETLTKLRENMIKAQALNIKPQEITRLVKDTYGTLVTKELTDEELTL